MRFVSREEFPASIVLYVVLAVAGAFGASHAVASTPGASSTPRAVLVTGASSGIGRAIVERLAAEGFVVYATARKDADLEALAKLPNVEPLRLDVTRDAEIAAAVETVRKRGRGLYAVVNNAGVALLGQATDTTPEDFDFVMQVNVYGPYRVTRAFAPLVVESKGRLTTIGSISGTLSGRTLAAYSMSKHAVEAFTDSLAAQMAPLGVAVSVVEPGNFDSEIGRNAGTRTGSADPLFADRSKYPKPTAVADAVLQFLTEATPKRRYMVTPNQREAEITIRKQIEELVQLNEGHVHTYDRDALVKMLDEALANARPRVPAPAQP